MRHKFIVILIAFSGLVMLSISSCKKDKAGSGDPSISVSSSNHLLDFGTVVVGKTATQTLSISGSHLTGAIAISSSDGYTISFDTASASFSGSVSIAAADVASAKTMYLKFTPTVLGVKTGTVKFESANAEAISVDLTGTGGIQRNYTAFSSEQLGFGSGLSQSATHQYELPPDVSTVNKINMYVKLRCPSNNCGDWDVYAHVQIKDPDSGEWYEMGRYITPYGVDNHQSGRGFLFDVTDFKSLLHGTVTLRAFTEVWTADGWLLSVDFDFLEGTPDYKYSSITKVLQYNDNSLGGVIYGEDASAFDLTKTITIPTNAEATSLRTIITGWGEQTPADPGGLTCAEFCFRTHKIKINGADAFSHYLGPIGCSTNPVQPQSGTYQYDRAGWCPGMAVPVREDQLATAMAGQSFNFEYYFSPWINNLSSGNPNPHAYYAISTYVVVKSNTPVVKATVN